MFVLLFALVAGLLLLPSPRDVTLERALRLHAASLELNARLLSSTSATATLTDWCRNHGLAEPATVTARRDIGAAVPATPEQRAALGATATDPIEYRRVELRCGARLLSRAENWYVPSRLTDDMRRQLSDPSSEVPFGTVIRPLEPSRRTTAATVVWTVLPPRWESGSLAELRRYARAHRDQTVHRDDRPLFEHHAIVSAAREPASGRPVALVRETYQMGTLAFLAEHP